MATFPSPLLRARERRPPARRPRRDDPFEARCPTCGAGLGAEHLEIRSDRLTCLFCGSPVAPGRPDPAQGRPRDDGVGTLGRLPRERSARRRPRPIALAVVSIAVLAAVAAFGRGGEPVADLAADAADAPATQDATAASDRGVDAPEARADGPPSRPDVVRPLIAIDAVERCWVRVERDGEEVFARTLEAGERESFRIGGGLAVTLGNAGGVRITAGDRPIRTGATGEVVELEVGVRSGAVVVTSPTVA
jgi:hypothetical protein